MVEPGHAPETLVRLQAMHARGRDNQQERAQMRRCTTLVALLGLLFGGLTMLVTSPAVAHGNENGKITFCHYDGSNDHGGSGKYTSITTNLDAFYHSGHIDHSNDIYPAGQVVKRGKVVASWDAQGDQSLLQYKNCEAPEGPPAVEKDAEAAVSTTEATCDSPEVLHWGDIEHATFSGTADGTEGPGEYDVVATADDGHLFLDGPGVENDGKVKEFKGTLDGQLTGEQCESNPPPPTCPEGQVLNDDGQCVTPPCPDGQVRGDDGTCTTPTPPPCPDGQVRGDDGQCVTPTPPPCTGDDCGNPCDGPNPDEGCTPPPPPAHNPGPPTSGGHHVTHTVTPVAHHEATPRVLPNTGAAFNAWIAALAMALISGGGYLVRRSLRQQ